MNESQETRKTNRRDFLSLGAKVVAGSLIYEKLGAGFLFAQEIKSGENFQSGLDKLRKRVMTSDKEVAAVLRIEKNGNVTWDNFQEGENYGVFSTVESVNSYLEIAKTRGDTIVYFHTHPVSGINQQPEVSDAQKRVMLSGKTKTLPSFPPSLPGPYMGGDYDRQMISQFRNENGRRIPRQVRSAIADPRGIWIMTLGPENLFFKRYNEIKQQMDFVFEEIKKDEKLSKVKINVIKQDNIHQLLLSYAQNHLGDLEIRNQSRLIQILDEWNVFIKNNLEILNKVHIASFNYFTQSISSGQVDPKDVIDAFRGIGANVEFIAYDKLTVDNFK